MGLLQMAAAAARRRTGVGVFDFQDVEIMVATREWVTKYPRGFRGSVEFYKILDRIERGEKP